MNGLARLLPVDFEDCRQRKNDDDRDDDPALANSNGVAAEESK